MSNITKFTAYKNIAKSFEDAVSILNKKTLAFGEPAVVPFWHPYYDDENRTIRLLMGVGSLNGKVEILSNINYDSSTRIDDATVYVRDASTVMTLVDALDYLSGKINNVEGEIPIVMDDHTIDNIINNNT